MMTRRSVLILEKRQRMDAIVWLSSLLIDNDCFVFFLCVRRVDLAPLFGVK